MLICLHLSRAKSKVAFVERQLIYTVRLLKNLFMHTVHEQWFVETVDE